MQGNRPILAINIVVLLILGLLAVRFLGFRSGAGQANADNAAAEDLAAKDATAKASTSSAAPTAAGVSSTVTAIAGSSNIILNLPGETVNATPFIRDFRAEDGARHLVEEHNSECIDEGELYNRTTGQLWAVSLTTQTVFEVDQLCWDAQNGRLFLTTTNKLGQPSGGWGHFCLTGHFVSELERVKRLQLITGDRVRRIFVLAGSSESSEH
jgi:hypothetical protein